MKLVELPQVADLGRLYSGYYDDFHDENADKWITIGTNSGTALALNEVGGVLALVASDGTAADNDESYFHSNKETFKILDKRPIVMEAGIKYTEGNTDDANIMVGVLNAWVADHLLDDGAGVVASFSGACFSKVDGGTTWIANSNNAATTKKTVLDATGSLTGVAITAGGGTLEILRIEMIPLTSAKVDFLFYHNGVLVAKHKDQPYSGATEISVGFGVKNGGANLETLDIDYVFAYQKRA